MFVTVNGARLFFDVAGEKLVPDGAAMREKPTVLLLHGGPGFDHSHFKPAWSSLSDIAQVVFYDHRGNGRSERGDKAGWSLAQWGDDVRGLCDALGIEKPIVVGVSFGGFVAQSYATRHPDHPAKLVLVSTAAKSDWEAVFAAFEELGGAEARRLAEDFWLNPTLESRRIYREKCHPLYYTAPDPDPLAGNRSIINDEVSLHFNGPGHEGMAMDFRAALAGIRCPTLVMSGDRDPITPLACSEVIAAHLPPHLVQFARFPNCGHGVIRDAPEAGFARLRAFIQE